MASQMKATRLMTAGSRQIKHIVNQPIVVIAGQIGRIGTRARRVTSLIGRDDPVTGFGKRRNLIPPGMPRLRIAVQENDQIALAWPGDPGIKDQPGAGGDPVQLRLFGSTHREHSLKSRMARGRQAVPL
jgi:hypothetical protein